MEIMDTRKHFGGLTHGRQIQRGRMMKLIFSVKNIQGRTGMKKGGVGQRMQAKGSVKASRYFFRGENRNILWKVVI